MVDARMPPCLLLLRYLVNLEKEPLEWSVQLNTSLLPNATEWSCSPCNGTLAAVRDQEVVITLSSRGIFAGQYKTDILVTSTTDVLVDAIILVVAKADVNFTKCNIHGTPQIGERWEGMQLFPHDADGFPITSRTSDSWEVTLSRCVCHCKPLREDQRPDISFLAGRHHQHGRGGGRRGTQNDFCKLRRSLGRCPHRVRAVSVCQSRIDKLTSGLHVQVPGRLFRPTSEHCGQLERVCKGE